MIFESAASCLERGMYADMEQWNDIRKRVLVEGVSKRSILRETGMHWCTTKNVELFSKLKNA